MGELAFMFPENSETLVSLKKLSKDLKLAGKILTDAEARFLVSQYYMIQENRKRSANQRSSLEKRGLPNELIEFIEEQQRTLEKYIVSSLDAYSDSNLIGRWARKVDGVGPIIAAGLMAHINIDRAHTAGSVWRFAGYDPTRKWLGTKAAESLFKEVMAGRKFDESFLPILADRVNVKTEILIRDIITGFNGKTRLINAENVKSAMARCPYSQKLKALCWKIGESFVKVSGNEDAFYGKLYSMRKNEEIQKNERGENKERCKKILEEKDFSDDTIAKKKYESGLLPDGHLHSRAKRWTVKIFLAHYQETLWEVCKGEPYPYRPYVESQLNHRHIIERPFGLEGL